jgi:putative phosphoesterase
VRVGIVSDTHGLLDPALPALLAGCDLLLHAGDVGSGAVARELARLAPLRAVRGNVDEGPDLEALPEWTEVEVGDARWLLVHEARPDAPSPLLRRLLARHPESTVVVHGHSHRPGARVVDGRLFLNPGSAGPRRFSLPRTACVAVVAGGLLEAMWWTLGDGPPVPHGSPFSFRPGAASTAERDRGR